MLKKGNCLYVIDGLSWSGLIYPQSHLRVVLSRGVKQTLRNIKNDDSFPFFFMGLLKLSKKSNKNCSINTAHLLDLRSNKII